VETIDAFYKESEADDWVMIGRNLENMGFFGWYVHNTPTTEARVRIVASDGAGNAGEDSSDAVFAISLQSGGLVATTLRDFFLPGSQPFESGDFQSRAQCAACHGFYDSEVEPDFNFRGSMMGNAVRDPLFAASLVIAEQDARSSGDYCLRCHAPIGWLLGNCNPTDGLLLTPLDKEGVSCDFCHRMVDPIFEPGESPPEDEAILDSLKHVPTSYGNAMYVVDPEIRRRGPYDDVETPHPFLQSSFYRTSEYCGTCHNVMNPVFVKVGDNDYAPGPLDEEAEGFDFDAIMPLEQTYSEWLYSDFPEGVYAPDFAGNKPDGIVAVCQDCHMKDVEGKGCIFGSAPVRRDLGLHDFMGGNSWIPSIMTQVYSGADSAALDSASNRALSMLEKSALLDLFVEPEADSFRAEVTVTNRAGHKLPTGFPEGRRMWIHLVATDQSGGILYESGSYDSESGVLFEDEDITIYEAELGFSPEFAAALGMDAGTNFHFAISDTLFKDNRIPPMGFTNADYALFGGQPVDPDHEGPEPRYEDGQHWDIVTYSLPASTFRVMATLYYQTTTKEYVEFLRDENSTNSLGQEMYDLWAANDRAAPVAMVADTFFTSPSSVYESGSFPLALRFAGPNPFANALDLRLDLPRPERIVMQVYDVQGRRIRETDFGLLGGGPHRLRWEGRDDKDHDVGSGIYWIRVQAGDRNLSRRVVRIQ
jgi:hypothetical protein